MIVRLWKGAQLALFGAPKKTAPTSPPRPGLNLLPSKKNPQVRRWQRTGNRPPEDDQPEPEPEPDLDEEFEDLLEEGLATMDLEVSRIVGEALDPELYQQRRANGWTIPADLNKTWTPLDAEKPEHLEIAKQYLEAAITGRALQQARWHWQNAVTERKGYISPLWDVVNWFGSIHGYDLALSMSRDTSPAQFIREAWRYNRQHLEDVQGMQGHSLYYAIQEWKKTRATLTNETAEDLKEAWNEVQRVVQITIDHENTAEYAKELGVQVKANLKVHPAQVYTLVRWSPPGIQVGEDDGVIDTLADLHSIDLHGGYFPGHHWGSVARDNPVAMIVAGGRLREPDKRMDEYTRKLTPGERLKAIAYRRYAQRRLQDFPSSEHPTLTRGMRIPLSIVDQLKDQVADREWKLRTKQETPKLDLEVPDPPKLTLTGCTAFTFHDEVSHHYSDSEWTRKLSDDTSVPVVLHLRRDERVDNDIEFWHDHFRDDQPGFEVLLSSRAIQVTGHQQDRGGLHHFYVEVTDAE